jgi:hypothetical protein
MTQESGQVKENGQGMWPGAIAESCQRILAKEKN